MQAAERVLLAEDDEAVRGAYREALEQEGFAVAEAGTAQETSRLIAEGEFVAGVIDLVLPDGGGLDLLRAMRSRDPDVCLILITGYASLDSAVEAIRAGACDYLRKPLDAAELARRVRRGVEARAEARRNRALVDQLQRANAALCQRQEALERRLEAASEETDALLRLAKRIVGSAEGESVLTDVLAVGMQLLDATCGAVFRVSAEAQELVGHLAQGLPAEEIAATSIPFGEGVLGKAVAEQEAVVENDLVLDPTVPDERLRSLGLGSVLAVPLVRPCDPGGVLAFFDKSKGGFGQHDVDVAVGLAFGMTHLVACPRAWEQVAAPAGRPGDFVPIQDIAKKQ